jgi:hypothetical protein
MSRILAAMDDLDAAEDDSEEYDDGFDFEGQAAARRQERDAKTDGYRNAALMLMQSLAQGMQQLAATQADLQKVQGETLKAIHSLNATMMAQHAEGGDASSKLAKSIQDMQAVLSAPRELVTDKDGKPVGVKIKHGG